MAEEINEPKDIQDKPQATESVKHVHLDRKRPKLSKFDDENSKNGKDKSPEAGKKHHSQNSNRGKKSAQHNHAGKRDPKAKLRIIPLGGLDAIGKNMTAFECGNDMVLDDAGLMFPDDNHPGVDLILPDYSYVLEHADKLRGIVITHGHEDHTGSLPYLLKDLDRKVPIYATKLTLGLI